MKNKSIDIFIIIARLCCLLCLVMLQTNAAARQKRPFALFEKYADIKSDGYDSSKLYYVVFSAKKLPGHLRVVRQLDENTAIIAIPAVTLFDSLNENLLIKTATYNWKLSPGLVLLPGKQEQGNYTIACLNIEAMLTELNKSIPAVKIILVDTASASVVIQTDADIILEKILPLTQVIFIDKQQKPVTETGIIGYNRSFHGINTLEYSIPGANGKGMVAAVKEQQMEPADLDLYKRILPSTIAAGNVSYHATVISSIIGGAGNSYYDGRGMAYSCSFFSSSFDHIFPDATAILSANKVHVQNHSYGTVVQQFYGAEAVSYDAQTWTNRDLLHVFSSGNKGTDAATEGRYAGLTGYANLTGNFKMAKNIITVGAIDNQENVTAESSAGPLYDGRLAPQLVALGPNGTSDAAAMVTGAATVLQQVYADSNNLEAAPSALLRAILYNTATDIHNTGIDFKTGYGVLNAYEAVRAIQLKKYDGGTVSQNQVWRKPITVPPGSSQLKVTLAWTDTTAGLNNLKAISNDIDLEIAEMTTGNVYKPWVLNTFPHADSLNTIATRKRDSLNTAEQISIELPASGNYEIRVKGTAMTTTSLPFFIAVNIDTLNRFYFTSPQHSSDVNREENAEVFVKWKANIADPGETGDLYISYNEGVSWELIKQSQLLRSGQYKWAIKDTASRAILKMQTGFGEFFSKDFIISKNIRLLPDFVCADSLRFSWNKHVYANSYKIFALTDSPYLKHIFSVADSFVVIDRRQYPFKVFAVEPVLNNGLPASRSIAIDIDFQGVQCFYRTIYHELLDENRLRLIVELSIAAYVDSIAFEEVNSAGQQLRTFTGQKITNSNIYDQLVNELTTGTTYWRAKLIMKSGVIVYTETIAVLTSGREYILFYPNPVNRTSSLHHILQQGIPTDAKLVLYDMTGRKLADYSSIPDNLNVSAFKAGILLFRLFSKEGVLLQTGKIIIQ